MLPKINIQAKSHHQLPSLKLKHMVEPPVTKDLVNKNVKACQENKLILQHPCHNQAFQRRIKLVTEA